MTVSKEKKFTPMVMLEGGQRFRFIGSDNIYIMGRDYVDTPNGSAFECWNEIKNQSKRFPKHAWLDTKVEIIV